MDAVLTTRDRRMDPWDAVSTASQDVLVEILREAYSLFDIDNSGTMDSIEFEQVRVHKWAQMLPFTAMGSF